MSRIIFNESYIIVIPSFHKVVMYEHPFLHMFIGMDNCVNIMDKSVVSGIIFVDSQVKHLLDHHHRNKLFLLIDPSSSLAEEIKNKYLRQQAYGLVKKQLSTLEAIDKQADAEIRQLVEQLLTDLQLNTNKSIIRDERINLLVERVLSGEWINLSIKEIAKALYLSEGRLTHLFKEQMGLSLKSYLLLRKMEYAYKLILTGKSITYAALEAGFSSPAHLAYTCKKFTGITITDVLR